MKKYLATLVLLLPSLVFACDRCQCPYLLDIVIQNKTNVDCRLIQQEVRAGNVYSKELPLNILSGQTSKPYSLREENKAADILLSIQCGEDKFATFSSQKMREGLIIESENVSAAVVSLSNMDATYHIAASNCRKPVPSTIYWTLQ